MKTIYLIFMSLCVFILTSVLFVKQNTAIVFGNPSDFSSVSVTLENTLKVEEIYSLVQTIQEIDPKRIIKINLISAEDQLKDVQAALPTYSRGLFDDGEIAQILNPVIEVQLASLEHSEEIINRIRSLPGVSEVTFGNEWAEKN